MDKWDWRMMEIVTKNVATWSKDLDEGVGALLVSPDRRQVSWGFNGFPRSIEDTAERLNDKDLKNKLMVHAEMNAMLNSAVDISGWTLYCTKFPCPNCATAIIQKGITRVVSPTIRQDSRWIADQMLSRLLLRESGVSLTLFSLDTEA